MKTARLIFTTAVLAALAAADLDAQRGRRGRGRPGRPRPAVQPEPKPAEEDKPVENWLVVQGGDVYLGNGSLLRRATILVGDDKIHAVGQDVEIPEGATILDATGKFVSPGFVIVKATGMGAPSGGGRGGRGGGGAQAWRGTQHHRWRYADSAS